MENPKDSIEASWGLLEHTLAPRGRFEAILGPRFVVIFGSRWGPKSDLKTRCFLTRFGLRFGVQNVAQNRPRKLPRWPSNAQKRAKMSSKSLLHGSFSAPLKPYKNIVFYDGLGPPSCPRATREMPKSPHVATLSPQEATKRTARGDSDSELRKETETESEESQKRTPKQSPKRGPERSGARFENEPETV